MDEKRFALIDRNGDWRYPCKIRDRGSSRIGYRLGLDRFGQAEYTDDLERVIKAVVIDGESVRVKTIDGEKSKAGNSLSLHAQREIVGYWLAPELFHLVDGAKFQPMSLNVGPSYTVGSNLPVRFDAAATLSAEDFTTALKVLSPRISESQMAMLVGHASSPAQTMSMESIARLGGYASHKSANVQYGKLGRLFVEHFGFGGLENQTQVLAIEGPRDSDGHWQWTLRSALTEALELLDLTEPLASAPGVAEAVVEVDADQKSHGIPPTTRRALINARIGQGGYRERMLQLWGARCAVTGCTIKTVLIASHAKAWADASNQERLDEYNGLLLSASVDRLFDSGLIAFSDDGTLMVSPLISVQELNVLGLSGESRLRSIKNQHKPYLKAHRQQNGFSE